MADASIHVLHVVPGLEPGGMELALAGVIRGLSSPQMRHSIVCLKGEPQIAAQLPPATKIHCLHSRPNELLLPAKLLRLIRRVRPTVIHARNWGAWPDVALARLAAFKPVPLIFSFHGFASLPVPLRRRLAFRWLSRLTTHLLTVSEASRQMLAAQMGWPLWRVQVIPNGVDTERFSPADSARRRPSARLILGSVGSLTAVKNHALLVRACAALTQAGIDCEVRIAGDGPQRPELTRLIGSLGLADRVLLTGHTQDVPEFLRQLDVFVLPSLSEAHPNALLEAMACSLPCVAANVGGVAEVLEGGRCGLIVPSGDLDALVAAISSLAGAERRQELAAKARSQVCRKYDLNQMMDSYSRMYLHLSRRGRWGQPLSLEGRGWPEGPGEGEARSVGSPSPYPLPSRERGSDRLPADATAWFGRPRVLMLGPLPPLTGGMATVTTNLAASSLRDCCDLRVMNNGKVTAANRSLWAGVGAQLRMLGQVIAAIRRTRAQIVHIHTCALFSFWRDQLHMLWARLLGAKVVWHLHDGTFLQFVSKGGRLKRGLIRLGLRMGSAAIVLSEESRRNLRAHVPKANWQVVTNGVQLPEIARRDVAGLTKFLFLGNLTRRKGAFDLADAAEAATAQGANLQVILAGGEVVAGQRQELVNHIMQLRCHERIVLCGLLAGLDKERALAEADCLVLPSYAEGLPMAVLEGMSYGLPVIASRVGAIPEAVEDGSEGFLLDSGDVEGLSRCMLRLCAEPELRRQMGERARLRAEKYFNLDVVVGKIMTIYHDILATQAKRENCG